MESSKTKRLLFVAFLLVVYILGSIFFTKLFTVNRHIKIELIQIEKINENKNALIFEDSSNKKLEFLCNTMMVEELEIGKNYNVSTNGLNTKKIKHIERYRHR